VTIDLSRNDNDLTVTELSSFTRVPILIAGFSNVRMLIPF